MSMPAVPGAGVPVAVTYRPEEQSIAGGLAWRATT
jgi:hypothetical protein